MTELSCMASDEECSRRAVECRGATVEAYSPSSVVNDGGNLRCLFSNGGMVSLVEFRNECGLYGNRRQC